MIGEMRHRVTLQQPVLTPDGAGGFTRAWQNLATAPEVYAEIATLSAGEQFAAHQLQQAATHRVTLRYRADVTASMRILKGAAVYNIMAVTDRGSAGAWLDILAVLTSPA